jgi:hypothetical protein
MRYALVLVALLFCLIGCSAPQTTKPSDKQPEKPSDKQPQKTVDGTFGSDLQFLQKNTDVILLKDKSGQAQVAVVAGMQGRVMTSTAGGAEGLSFGWINREAIGSKELKPHMNAYGGEERFWMGPEGGQFSIFFAKGAAFDFEHWQTPAPIDTDKYDVVKKSSESATFRRAFQLVNYSGTRFDVEVTREVRMLPADEVWKKLNVTPVAGARLVAYETINQVKNAGNDAWTKETGLLSIWILSMFNPSPGTTIVVPIKGGPESEMGPMVNADYFGKVPPERLVVKNDTAFFSGDGKYRSKIGVSPKRCKPLLGSYDATNSVLTLAQFTFDEKKTEYVNSMWKLQDQPFAGDAANSYNDGPPAPGVKPMGPFYELESSSPAAALKPGETIEHVHRTIHILGTEEELNTLAKATLGVGLQEINSALPK